MKTKKLGWTILEKIIQTIIFVGAIAWFLMGAMWLAGKFSYARKVPIATTNKTHNDEVIKKIKIEKAKAKSDDKAIAKINKEI